MRVIIKQHPGTGLWVTSDGRVIMPPDGHRFFKFRFTFGCNNGKGYMRICFRGRYYKIHRMVAQAFIPNPENLPEIDHINRVRHDNRVENLRWVDRKTQMDNMQKVDDALARYGVRKCKDPRAYARSLYANNQEFAERCRAHKRTRRADPEFAQRELAKSREYEATQCALGKRRRKCPDGKTRRLTDSEFNARFGISQQIPLF